MIEKKIKEYSQITVPFSAEELSQTPEASPELTKRSWFGSLMSTDRDETYTIIVKEKPLASIKADLIQAFLSVRYILVHFFKETVLPRWLTNAYVKSSICKVMGFSAQNILALWG